MNLNTAPRIALNTLVGLGTIYGVQDALYHADVQHIPMTQPERVQACAELLGHQSLTDAEFTPCRDYLADGTITATTPVEGHMQFNLKMPTKSEFLARELPAANHDDEQRINGLHNERAMDVTLGVFASLITVALSNAGMRRVERKLAARHEPSDFGDEPERTPSQTVAR